MIDTNRGNRTGPDVREKQEEKQDEKEEEEEDDEDDYLTMTLPSAPPASSVPESSLARTARLKREALSRGHVASKAEREAAARLALEEALAQPAPLSRGAKMMARMGFRAGEALGASGREGRREPVEVRVKEGRGGVGLSPSSFSSKGGDEGKKKKRKRDAEGGEGLRETEDEFRARNVREREEKRAEGQMWSAMRVVEELEEGKREEGEEEEEEEEGEKKGKKVNVLYRALIKRRTREERERQMDSSLTQSLSRKRRGFDDEAYEDEDDRAKQAREVGDRDDEDESDSELDEFEALSPAERRDSIVAYMRDRHNYCFWCKHRYPDAQMDGCPGTTEDEHG